MAAELETLKSLELCVDLLKKLFVSNNNTMNNAGTNNNDSKGQWQYSQSYILT